MRIKTARGSLLYGTLLLFISNVLVKGLGFGYRVILVRMLGAEGMGLVEMVTPIYAFLLVLAGLGLQPALAQKVAGSDAALAGGYFRTARRLLLLSGSVVTVGAVLLSPLLVRWFAADARVGPALLALLPAVLIVSLASARRGWFHGRRELGSLGMSQNVEQAARVVLGVWLVRRLRPAGLARAAAGVSLATVGGELAGYLYLVLRGGLRRPQRLRKRTGAEREQARQLLAYGLPMTGGRLVNSVLLMLQAFLIPCCLQRAGYGVTAATEIYGRFSGVALTLLHLPGVFASALATAVMPAAAASKTDAELLLRHVVRPLQAVLICTLPGMALLYLYAYPLAAGLFNNAPAAPLLRLLTPGGVFLYLQTTLAGVLQGLGDVKRLLINNAVAGILLLAGVVWLVPREDFGICGAAVAMDLSWLCGFLLHLAAVRRHLVRDLPWTRVVCPSLLALVAAVVSWAICRSAGAGHGIAIVAAGAAYLLALLPQRRRLSL